MISDEAVEAAARVFYHRQPNGTPLFRERDRARAALEAAMPHLLASRGSGQRGSGEQPEPTSSAAAALAREATDEPTESEYWRDRRERMESGETPYNSDYVDEFPRFGRF